MSFKTILVQCDHGTATSRRLVVATELAGRFDARLVGVHATPPFEVPLFAEDGVSIAPLYEAHEEGAAANKAASRALFDQAVKGKHLSIEWRPIGGRVDDVLTVCGRYADLLVVGQSQADDATQPGGIPEAVALASGRPVLVVPFIGVERPVGQVVMLCWNASRESARAATDALPILKAAQTVIVLVVEPTVTPEGHGEEPGADVSTWLARHGVKVTVQRDVAPDGDVGSIILSRAADHDVDLIVMGLYGHSRLREMVLGGVSRTMLSAMTVPVLMAH